MLQDIKVHVQMPDVNQYGRAISGGATLSGLLREVGVVVGHHSTCNIDRKTYTEEEIMRSVETGFPLTSGEEKVPYVPCNMHSGFNSEIYDPKQAVESDEQLTTESEAHIGSASIDEPDPTRKSGKPFYLLLAQRVYHAAWQIGDAEGGDWYDCMCLVLQRTGKKKPKKET
jgi:hypothetical protein